jgi:hypothetical protein
LDVHQFQTESHNAPATTCTDSQPLLPQRHASVTAGQSSSLLSTTSSSLVMTPKKSSVTALRSSDLSPRQPGRKMSLQTLPLGSSGDAADTTGNHHKLLQVLPITPPFGRSDTKDSLPLHPSRKQSGVASVGDVASSNEFPDFAKLFQEAIRSSEGSDTFILFSGHDAITRMMETHMVETRQEGLEVGQVLLDDEVFSSADVSENTPFADSIEVMYLIKATPPPPPTPSSVVVVPSLLSGRRKTDTNICIEEESPLQEDTAKQIDVPHVMMKR